MYMRCNKYLFRQTLKLVKRNILNIQNLIYDDLSTKYNFWDMITICH